MPSLVNVHYQQDGRPRSAARAVVSIGRGEENAVILNDPKVSRQHVELRAVPPGVEIRDLGSTNGTTLILASGREVLRSGMRLIFPGAAPIQIGVGDTVLSVTLTTDERLAAAPSPPRPPHERQPEWRPAPPAAQPGWAGQQEERRHAAATRSYVTPAVITLILYLFMWLPGLIVNLVYLQHAGRDAALLGQDPDGKGCLTALIWVFGVLPAMLLILGFVVWFVVLGAILSGAR